MLEPEPCVWSRQPVGLVVQGLLGPFNVTFISVSIMAHTLLSGTIFNFFCKISVAWFAKCLTNMNSSGLDSGSIPDLRMPNFGSFCKYQFLCF